MKKKQVKYQTKHITKQQTPQINLLQEEKKVQQQNEQQSVKQQPSKWKKLLKMAGWLGTGLIIGKTGKYIYDQNQNKQSEIARLKNARFQDSQELRRLRIDNQTKFIQFQYKGNALQQEKEVLQKQLSQSSNQRNTLQDQLNNVEKQSSILLDQNVNFQLQIRYLEEEKENIDGQKSEMARSLKEIQEQLQIQQYNLADVSDKLQSQLNKSKSQNEENQQLVQKIENLEKSLIQQKKMKFLHEPEETLQASKKQLEILKSFLAESQEKLKSELNKSKRQNEEKQQIIQKIENLQQQFESEKQMKIKLEEKDKLNHSLLKKQEGMLSSLSKEKEKNEKQVLELNKNITDQKYKILDLEREQKRILDDKDITEQVHQMGNRAWQKMVNNAQEEGELKFQKYKESSLRENAELLDELASQIRQNKKTRDELRIPLMAERDVDIQNAKFTLMQQVESLKNRQVQIIDENKSLNEQLEFLKKTSHSQSLQISQYEYDILEKDSALGTVVSQNKSIKDQFHEQLTDLHKLQDESMKIQSELKEQLKYNQEQNQTLIKDQQELLKQKQLTASELFNLEVKQKELERNQVQQTEQIQILFKKVKGKSLQLTSNIEMIEQINTQFDMQIKKIFEMNNEIEQYQNALEIPKVQKKIKKQ